MLKIKKSDLNKLYAAIAERQTLYIPCNVSGKVNYAVWGEGADVDLSTLKTVRSAKEVFFPQCEDIVSFKKEGKNISVKSDHKESEDFVVFGVRACDCRSFDILDRVFLSDPVDTFYKTKREHGTVITLACNRPEESCFCFAFGIDNAEPEGDIAAYFAGDYLYWSPKTEKGLNLTKTLNSLLLTATDKDNDALEKEQNNIRQTNERLPFYGLDLSVWGADGLLEKFNSEKWKELSEACVGCGACTFVCPTCQCYDVRDFDKGNGVQRYRCWDSCMYKDFTMMAHGTPRPTQMQRFRQRFMHKLVYYPSNNEGIFSCVGCGRCVEKCPIHMNIVKVIKAFGGEKNE
ncbi:MAG: 4Fe-4S dicluster domain-containing protein [Clostridia bacterium]|nr:4Fe-4S dicluster domain-containing protein [Clostridia bacterium]